jgi:hypothetical protein
MGTRHEVLGYVIVVKPYRKHGNGAKGGGRQGSSGKRCSLFKVDDKTQTRELVVETAGGTAAEAVRRLRESTRIIPTYVAISGHGETYF